MTREITGAALKLIERDEGLRLDAYRDPVGIETIGYGHTPAHAGQHISQAQAEDLLRHDVQSAARAVELAVGAAPTTDAQFSAMVSLAFNIGNGAFRQSSVLRKHRAGDHAGAAAAFLLWDKGHINGELVVMPGLLRRRNEERRMYLADAAPRPKPALAPQPPVPLAAPPKAQPAGNKFAHILRPFLALFGHRPAQATNAKPAPAPAVTRPAAPHVRGTAPPAQEDDPADNSAEALNAAELHRIGGAS